MSRPKLDIDPKLVEKFASIGCKNTEIADYFGCDEGTIRTRFSEILAKGRSGMAMSLRQWQLRAAEKGNAAMLIWLGKQVLGQRDSQDINLTGDSSKPIEIKLAYDPDGE